MCCVVECDVAHIRNKMVNDSSRQKETEAIEMWSWRRTGKIGEVVRYLSLPDKKNQNLAWLSRALATARIAPKICHARPAGPRQCTQSAPDFIKIGSVSAELYAYLNAWTLNTVKSVSNIRLKPSFAPSKKAKWENTNVSFGHVLRHESLLDDIIEGRMRG